MKKACLALSVIVLLISLSPYTRAHGSKEEHFADIERVLFGDQNYFASLEDNQEKKDKLQAIEYAATLAIDQYKGDDSKLLYFLKINMGIPDLPDNVFDTKEDSPTGINYTTSWKVHRRYTHLGWNWNYIDDKGNWPVRKRIIISTVNKVFDFGTRLDKPDPKCNAFCALIYYIHIIGDQESDSAYALPAIILPLGRQNPSKDNPDVFWELETYLSILFEDQKETVIYWLLMKRLNILSKKTRKLALDGISKEEVDTYQDNAKKLIHILEQHVPKLLSNESFFANVFPPV